MEWKEILASFVTHTVPRSSWTWPSSTDQVNQLDHSSSLFLLVPSIPGHWPTFHLTCVFLEAYHPFLHLFYLENEVTGMPSFVILGPMIPWPCLNILPLPFFLFFDFLTSVWTWNQDNNLKRVITRFWPFYDFCASKMRSLILVLLWLFFVKIQRFWGMMVWNLPGKLCYAMTYFISSGFIAFHTHYLVLSGHISDSSEKG